MLYLPSPRTGFRPALPNRIYLVCVLAALSSVGVLLALAGHAGDCSPLRRNVVLLVQLWWLEVVEKTVWFCLLYLL